MSVEGYDAFIEGHIERCAACSKKADANDPAFRIEDCPDFKAELAAGEDYAENAYDRWRDDHLDDEENNKEQEKENHNDTTKD